jgi:hypothetical protein
MIRANLSGPIRLLALVSAIVFAAGCSEDRIYAGDPVKTRTCALGLGYFPHDGTPTGVLAALDVIGKDADLLVAHFDGGIPWEAALASDFGAYPQSLREEVAFIAGAKPAGHELYLAVTPIAFLRDRLAPTLTDAGPVFQAPWDVIRAYRNHCHFMIDAFQPDYMAFGVEVNLFGLLVDDSLYASYRSLADSVHTDLKSSYPALPIFQTLQVDAYYANVTAQRALIADLLPTTDYVAVSAYPYGNAARYPDRSRADPAMLPRTYFSELRDIDRSKPFAVAETGWPAENLGPPYPLVVFSGTLYQDQYTQFVLDEAERLGGRFVNVLITRDYDALWQTALKDDPNAALLRLWRDIGMYDGNGLARPALATWRTRLARERR